MYNKYTGVILKKYPFNEADELLTIYTKEVGKLRVKAVSSRKIRSRLAGNLQSLNEIEFETASRGSRFRENILPVLISVRARTINNYLRENLKKFAYALVGVETLYRMTPDHETNDAVYRALVDFLNALGKSQEENQQVRQFQLKLLQTSGYKLPLQMCLNCQGPVAVGATAYFISAKGGFYCLECETRLSGQSDFSQSKIALSKSVLEQLRALLAGELVADLYADAEQVIDGFLHYVLEREIKANGFVKILHEEAA